MRGKKTHTQRAECARVAVLTRFSSIGAEPVRLANDYELMHIFTMVHWCCSAPRSDANNDAADSMQLDATVLCGVCVCVCVLRSVVFITVEWAQ